MNLVKCSRGHYYDGDKFSDCPHCRKMDSGIADTPTQAESEATVALDASPAYMGETEAWDKPTEEPAYKKQADKTAPLTVGSNDNWVHNITKPDEDTESTVAFYFGDMKTDPVVGWLVCIEGSSFGRSYNLKSGKNFIGRSFEMNDVVLEDDISVSRDKHAILVYDPKSRRFLAQPGMSSELFYVNDDVVLQATPLKDRDVIQVGRTKLMFISLCGPDFSWSDYEEETKDKD